VIFSNLNLSPNLRALQDLDYLAGGVAQSTLHTTAKVLLSKLPTEIHCSLMVTLRRRLGPMTLAVGCNSATKQYFNELGNPEPCVTPGKSQSLQDRLEKDAAYKRDRARMIEDKLLAGQITIEVYNVLMRRLDSTSIEDGVLLDKHPNFINNVDRKILDGKTTIENTERLDTELVSLAHQKPPRKKADRKK
jgi:hypothetical protein